MTQKYKDYGTNKWSSNRQENCVAGIISQLHFFIGYTGLLEDKKRVGEIIPTDKK